MKAAIINQYGTSHELQIQDVPRPEVDSHEVLIRVHATGINPLDTKVRQGAMKLMLPGSFPKILGAECAGVVEEVGLMVSDFQPGDRVVASLGTLGAGYAEYAVAKEKNVVKLPDAIDFIQAAAMPIAAGTALQAMRDKGHLRPNDRVLINGAAGGVGTFAVQIARIIGAHITAVCSTDNAALVRQLGADVVIDYKTTDFTKLPDKFEVVFDAVGKSSFDACRDILTPEGTYVTTTPSPRQILEEVVTIFTKQKADSLIFSFTQEDMNWLIKQVTAGKLVSVIEKTYPLDSVAQAHEYSETGHVKGKLVLVIR
ncbi:NAD(P)-dependent alcohol dehydrogenase [Fibrella forsythiae]|uniref:NAD(P)-dependent alcohol dehydrogenase n=1 Tax=Fibrella forsythiae TaxID=2817061 RepID=A0ABS3JD99_9BACT|nr:NAD(P)-dependent alcohol dehydrogenase [Fibrella forsythiae]MBO0947978.1 NAD(P)-dependent alcohol dehydrogenase [Fibrella forsythiae]